ncbi:MAG TPA: hypothetical protein VGR20_21760, partial [Acidimicrobiia bacterium]|nr:hypothetical protein [Acidimicrobiia bacterium]
DGGIFTFGDAAYAGSLGNLRLNRPIVGMASTPTGAGYWMVASDGGIFTFGDARFYGSTGGIKLKERIAGMASTATGAGYWLVAADGGVFTFGDAAFKGSMGSSLLDGRIVGLMPQGGDVRAPVLRHLSFGPKTVDTSKGEAAIKFRANITDDMAGVSNTPGNGVGWIGSVVAQFQGPGGVHINAGFHATDRVEGDTLDGIYKTTICLPAHSPSGTWTLTDLQLFDAVGNQAQVAGQTLAQAGFPTTFTQTSAGDTELPRLRSLSMSTTSVDTSAAPATIHLTAQLTDNDTGIAYVGADFATGPTNHVVYLRAGLGLKSGTLNDGIFEGNLIVPRYYRRGFWQLSSVFLRDSAGNMGSVFRDDLAAAGAPTGFYQVGADDTTPPVIHSVAVTPAQVDTSTGPATVTVTVRASDDTSGLFLEPDGAITHTSVTFVSPSRQQASAALELVSGDDHDAILVAHVTIPHHSEQGTWTLQWVSVGDHAMNGASPPATPLTIDVIRTGG